MSMEKDNFIIIYLITSILGESSPKFVKNSTYDVNHKTIMEWWEKNCLKYN